MALAQHISALRRELASLKAEEQKDAVLLIICVMESSLISKNGNLLKIIFNLLVVLHFILMYDCPVNQTVGV